MIPETLDNGHCNGDEKEGSAQKLCRRLAGGKPKTAANTNKAAFRADGGRKEAASLK